MMISSWDVDFIQKVIRDRDKSNNVVGLMDLIQLMLYIDGVKYFV